VEFDPASAGFSMNPEQALALTVEGGSAFIPGAFEIALAQFKPIPKMASVLRTCLGFGWHEHELAGARSKSSFHGFDDHAPSVQAATQAAERAGLASRVRFEVALAKTFPGQKYDLVAMFDCLHDMGEAVTEVGFGCFRRAAQTPLNLIYEAHP
jgi:hypothetical protein